MKKISVINSITVFLLVMFISATVFQCRKTGDLISGLDRSFKGTADSLIYTSFYDNHVISTADVPGDVNDTIKTRGIQTIIGEYCGTSNCHGGPINPKFDTYSQIMQYVTAGNPETSKLWEFLTTNDFDQAMPPVNSNKEMTITDKALLYNWIKNGAKERPDLNDFRPAAIALIVTGCGSANCHSQETATGAWARKGLYTTRPLTTSDTTTFTFTDQATGAIRLYCLLKTDSIRDRLWNEYKDSVNLFYSDTIGNASYRPFKTFATPWVMPTPSPSIRGPLNSYDDILMDVLYPKNIRSNSSVVYTDPVTLANYYAKTNYLNSNDCFIRRIDSTLIYINPVTGTATSVNGSMAWDDGGLSPAEVALIKAWYFADPNIPPVWKYGTANAGIFKYRKTGNLIRQ